MKIERSTQKTKQVKKEEAPVEIASIKELPLGFLYKHLADYNPRTISDEARDGLSASIGRFGLVSFPVFNTRTDRVVGGHQRIKDLIARGVPQTQKIPTAIVDLEEAEEKALNVTLNNARIQGEFDAGLLTEVLNSLSDSFSTIELEELSLSNLITDFSNESFANDDSSLGNGKKTDVEAPEEFKEYTEDIPTEHTCPKCGYAWSGGA